MEIEKITGRIGEQLEQLKKYTATPGKGCTRLPFTNEARQAVEFIRKQMESVGLKVHEDEAGNIIGLMEGEDLEQPCVMMGSHLDSVVNGGDYDGIAGIICAIEVVRCLKERGIRPKRSFAVVGFCDEEGMRFGNGYFGSGAIMGTRDTEYCRKFKDTDGISIYEAMKKYGLDPEKISSAKWPEGSIGCFLEIHIEQGPVLDSEEIEIGLVDCIVGIQRYIVTVQGRSDHAGTTPMDMRIDAVDAASKVIGKIGDWAKEKGDGTVATVGYIRTTPGGVNIIAEKCTFTVDIRSRNNDNITDIANRIYKALEQETKTVGGNFEMEKKLSILPVNLDRNMLDIMEKSCREHGYSSRYLPSGAGHDSLEIAQFIPTAMLFVPSENGRSHCPEEYTPYSYLAKATVVAVDLVEKLLIDETAERE